MPSPGYTPTLPLFIRSLAQRFGDHTLCVLGERRLRYAEAERSSAHLARGLLAAGVAKGARVAVLQPNGPDWITCWLAAARIGAVVVPINTFYQTRELAWILRHADAHALLTADRFLSHDYLARLEDVAPDLSGQRPPLRLPSLPFLREVYVWGEGEPRRSWTRDGPEGLPALAEREPRVGEELLRQAEDCVAPADPMVLIYSSGSTADPKGALHGHGAVLRHSQTLAGYRDLRSDDRIYSPMPFFWVGGFVYALLGAMHHGACVLCEEVFEPGATLALLERERATLVAGWPHYSKAMAEHPSFPERDLSSIRGGNLYDILPAALRPADVELRSNSLGMTETCGPHTMERMDRDLPEKLRGSFGRPVPGVEHKVVDPETGETLPPGEFGEVCVRGTSLMQGLHKLEREETFDADGYYHTGDGGSFNAEGVLFFKGRLGDLVKTGGANVSPREVEVVLESAPAVQEAYVVGVPDPARGQNVAAAVVLQAGSRSSEEELRAFVKSQLSAYKVPRHVLFLDKPELPFTDTGKIDKRRLTRLLCERLSIVPAP